MRYIVSFTLFRSPNAAHSSPSEFYRQKSLIAFAPLENLFTSSANYKATSSSAWMVCVNCACVVKHIIAYLNFLFLLFSNKQRNENICLQMQNQCNIYIFFCTMYCTYLDQKHQKQNIKKKRKNNQFRLLNWKTYPRKICIHFFIFSICGCPHFADVHS